MYRRKTHLRHDRRRSRRRKKRNRITKRILSVAAAVFLVCLGVFLLRHLPVLQVSAASKQVPLEKSPGAALKGYAMDGMVSELRAAGMLIEPSDIPVVFIDAGHGGEDEGCERAGIQEKNINLAIAKRVRDKLEALGYEVIMAREDDAYVAKEDRVRMANAARADIYVSIHQNASEDEEVSGMEVWYEGTDTLRDNKRLAQLLRQQTARKAETVERELRGDADFHVTGKTRMPACLIETGFLSNAGERARLTTDRLRKTQAEYWIF